MRTHIVPIALQALLIVTMSSLSFGVTHAGAASAARPVHAATALQAVRVMMRPYDMVGYNFTNCTTKSPRRNPGLTCPETPRLLHWLAVRRLPVGDSGLAFCRCQSPPRAVRVWQLDNNGHMAHVAVRWMFGQAGSPRTISTDTFVVLHRSIGWLIDDEYCTGHPWTSVYRGAAGAAPCR
jgi:hypothetical protein